jgi:hypothetical protein
MGVSGEEPEDGRAGEGLSRACDAAQGRQHRPAALLDFWHTLPQLDSTFQKSRSLSRRLSRQAWKTRSDGAWCVPKSVEFTLQKFDWQSSTIPPEFRAHRDRWLKRIVVFRSH